MAETPYNHYALYEPDAAPDLTASGEYNSAVMAIDTDMHDEETERKAADAKLTADLAAETARATAAERKNAGAITKETTDRTSEVARVEREYKAADTALGTRVGNAETEISANSANLTGIKGLTYGEQHVHFVESDNGEYSSPALDEIAEQMGQRMTCIQIQSTATTVDTATLDRLTSDWPNVVLIETSTDPLASGLRNTTQLPLRKDDSTYWFIPSTGNYSDEGEPYAKGLIIEKTGKVSRFDVNHDPYWSNISSKPFTEIGLGLQVLDDTLTIDQAVFPKGITANTTWGELEADLIQ